ncbi:PucR family transcriptional regulator [Streptacidiphilus sp. N1-3]|uniref:PucR family transcriptional regulator n=1 Tax=Streptacidiphilus alkalitolerans TaxID=3342712 RepID=A0ABV6XBQ2_9ACTN
MEHKPQDRVGAQVAELGTRMVQQAEPLADALVDRIRAAVPVYRTDAAVSAEELRRTCLDNIHFVFGSIGRVPALNSPESRENGRQRARAGVPLTAVMEAYRVAARFLWEQLADTAARSAVPAEVTVRAASEMWLVLDTYTQHMAEGYREEITAQLLSREQERSALLEALLEGRLAEADLWDAADVLRIPARGPYVVIAARVPDIGRHALPQAEAALRGIGAASAWRLLHDVEVGVARLPGSGSGSDSRSEARSGSGVGLALDRLAEVLGSDSGARVGVSPPYDDLRETASALRLARIALRGAFDGRRVTLFDRDPLAVVAAVGTPEVMRHIARSVLVALDRLSPERRSLLLSTFGAWLDSGGSADQAAGLLFCHPNTVRHRLRRLEEHTGRSLADPRGIAELSVAFEIDRRVSRAPRPR